MGKKKKVEEKTFTLDEFDEASFNAGFLRGMEFLDTAHHKALRRLMQSFSDVWASYHLGTITPERQRVSEQMSLVVNALETLEDMFTDAHEMERGKLVDGQGMTGEELFDFLENLEKDE